MGHQVMTRCGVMILASVGAAAALLAGAPQVRVWTFDDLPLDASPADFTLASMRQPAPGRWVVRPAGAGRHLVHLADPSARGWALALAPGDPLRDVVISARLRLAGGARAGGLVWRYQDPDNFFVAALDLTRRDLRLFRVTNGNRVTMESEDDLELDVDAWHVLKVVHHDASVSVSLGGIRVFEERDRGLDRFGPGRIGLMASGDADVGFDDLRVEPSYRRR